MNTIHVQEVKKEPANPGCKELYIYIYILEIYSIPEKYLQNTVKQTKLL